MLGEGPTHIFPVLTSRPVSGQGFQKLISDCVERMRISELNKRSADERQLTILDPSFSMLSTNPRLSKISNVLELSPSACPAGESSRCKAVSAANASPHVSKGHRCRALRCACR